jgi:anti-sigma factor (TIGR02949 family)
MSGSPDRLTCEEAFRRLDDFLDHELSPDEMRLVREHLETCAQCSQEFHFEQSVIAGLRDKLARIEAPPDLLSRLTEHLGRGPE